MKVSMRVSMNRKVWGMVFFILLLDQIVKIWIKTHMTLGQEFHVLGDWFIIHFTENNGMAFGMEFGGEIGKLLLSLFRIATVCLIGWWINHLIRRRSAKGFIYSLGLVLAGAIGNIIDSMFYGVIFSDSQYRVAELFPQGGGYSGFLQGKVVDMLYFPIVSGHFPSWFPFWAAEPFVFFRPVFNLADTSITIGVLIILIFYRKVFIEDTAS